MINSDTTVAVPCPNVTSPNRSFAPVASTIQDTHSPANPTFSRDIPTSRTTTPSNPLVLSVEGGRVYSAETVVRTIQSPPRWASMFWMSDFMETERQRRVGGVVGSWVGMVGRRRIVEVMLEVSFWGC